jgi:hypothetical protein
MDDFEVSHPAVHGRSLCEAKASFARTYDSRWASGSHTVLMHETAAFVSRT